MAQGDVGQLREACLMNTYLVDTRPIIWHFMDRPKLSAKVRDILDKADRGEDPIAIVIASIVVVELVYAAE